MTDLAIPEAAPRVKHPLLPLEDNNLNQTRITRLPRDETWDPGRVSCFVQWRANEKNWLIFPGRFVCCPPNKTTTLPGSHVSSRGRRVIRVWFKLLSSNGRRGCLTLRAASGIAKAVITYAQYAQSGFWYSRYIYFTLGYSFAFQKRLDPRCLPQHDNSLRNHGFGTYCFYDDCVLSYSYRSTHIPDHTKRPLELMIPVLHTSVLTIFSKNDLKLTNKLQSSYAVWVLPFILSLCSQEPSVQFNTQQSWMQQKDQLFTVDTYCLLRFQFSDFGPLDRHWWSFFSDPG